MRHGDHEPCAVDVMTAGGLSPEEALAAALEFTCFPMDCALASEQAQEFLRNVPRGGRKGGGFMSLEGGMDGCDCTLCEEARARNRSHRQITADVASLNLKRELEAGPRRVVIISDETMACDTCVGLVRQGRLFTCERVEGGWAFELKEEVP